MNSAIRVLHVDDEPDIADLVGTFLKREDGRFEVETARNVSEGLDSLDSDQFDCIVSDYDMPGENGIQFLEAVREEYPDIPFILYTGKGSEEVASEAVSAGVTEYLQKESGTSHYRILCNRIQNVVEKQRVKEEVEGTKERLQTIAENSNDILWQFSADWDELRFINSPYEKIWGRSIDELGENPMSFLKGVHPADRDYVKSSMDELSAGESVDIEFRVNADEDFGRWVWVQGNPVFDDAGEVDKIVGFARDVTEYKKEERKREKIVARVTDAIVEIDASWRFTLVNEQAEELYDMDEEELLGRDFWEVFPEAIDSRFEEEYRRVMETREPTSFVEFFSQLDGWFDIEAYPKDDGGIEFYFVEVTERRERQRELEETNALLSTLCDALPQGVLVEDESREVLIANQEMLDLFDMSGLPEEIIGADCERMAEGISGAFAESEEFVERINDLVVEREPVDNEELALVDGRTVDRSYRPIELPEGKGHLWVYRDVSDRKERERRYSAIFNHTDQFTGLLEPDGTLVEANETALKFGGLDREQVLGKKLWESYWFQHSEETRERAREAVKRAAGGEFVRHELPVQGIDGEVIIDFSLRPLTDDRGNVTLLVPEGRDITDLKERERELKVRTRRLEALLENTRTPMFMKDDAGEYIFVNHGYRELFDLADEEIVGRTDHDIHPPGMADKVRENDRAVLERGETLEAEERITVGDEQRTFLSTKTAIHDTGERSDPERPVAVFGVASDVTEFKERERQLQRERDRLDKFAGIVSHDLRNPLGVIEGRLELAREECDNEHLETIGDTLARMERIIDDLLWLAREGKDIGTTDPVDLREAVDAAWKVVGDTSDETAFVRVTGGHPSIEADYDRLAQLLENLFGNALEHNGEHVIVTVGELDDGFYVEDDGSGIPEGNREDVFEAGYSTSEHGTGLGLSIVKQVVEAHGWNISVTENSEGGARFEITGVEFAA